MVICKLRPSIIGYISMIYIYCTETVYFMMFGLELCWAGFKIIFCKTSEKQTAKRMTGKICRLTARI